MADEEFKYSSGFGNEFATEAVAGALPAGRNSPQQAPLGLYAEQLSGTAFTQPRGVNRRTWVYRILPSARHPAFRRIGNAVHLYAANRDMADRYFVDADGELLMVPELGTVVLHTELGPLRVSPGEVAVVPRGLRFRVEVPDGPALGQRERGAEVLAGITARADRRERAGQRA